MTLKAELETRIGRSPAAVFAELIALERYPQWLIATGVVGIEQLDPGPLAARQPVRIDQRVAGRADHARRPGHGPRARTAAGAAGQGPRGDQGRHRRGADAGRVLDRPALGAAGRPAAPLPDVRRDGRAAGTSRRGPRPRGVQAPPGVGRGRVIRRPRGSGQIPTRVIEGHEFAAHEPPNGQTWRPKPCRGEYLATTSASAGLRVLPFSAGTNIWPLRRTEAWTSVHDDSRADVDGFRSRAGLDCCQRDDLPDN